MWTRWAGGPGGLGVWGGEFACVLVYVRLMDKMNTDMKLMLMKVCACADPTSSSPSHHVSSPSSTQVARILAGGKATGSEQRE